MNFSFFTLKYSVFFLKTNFIFMIFLQITKFFIHNQTSNYSTVNTPQDLFTPKQQNESSIVKTFLTSFMSSFTYDIKELEATKTEILNIVKVNDNYNDQNDTSRQAQLNPTIVSESYVNFFELLHFNNLKHIIKLIYIFNFNINCILINLMLISYLLVQLKKKATKRSSGSFEKKFLKFNLILIHFLLLTLVLVDSIYMLFINSNLQSPYLSSKPTDPISTNVLDSKDSNFLLDYIFNSLGSSKNYFDKENANNDLVTIESSYSSLKSSNSMPDQFKTDGVLTSIALKINMAIMVFSICMLTVYSYMSKVETRNCEESDSKKSCCETKSSLKYLSEMEALICVNDDDDDLPKNSCDNFLKTKQKKIESNLSIDFQWIITSFYIIFLLSIWDMANVYQYFGMSESGKMNSFLHNSSSYQSFLSEIEKYNEKLLIPRMKDASGTVEGLNFSDLRHDPNFSGKINVLSDYYNKYDGRFFQHYFSHHNDQQFIKRESGSTTDKQFKTTTTIRALCVFKIHTQIFGELMILIFMLLILNKLMTVEKFIKWNSKKYLKNFRQKHAKGQIITL